ncbi:helix-turn-helix domain-containing protein [Streptomyces sp. NPDC091259]|uniref:helix-turn-helix domain-containing protein n=1 Tax=Streptomyces sp. NPDC091259 TaxID=3365976 RepID=UPI0037FDCC77
MPKYEDGPRDCPEPLPLSITAFGELCARDAHLYGDTAETVEDISAQVGYRSVPSFTRAFARDRGCSPGAYRAQVRADRALEPRAPGRRL